MGWPLYRSEMLIKGDPTSQVGIITLFTQKEQVTSFLAENDFALLGQLYNPSQGISILLRNCLSNKNIRYLLVLGQDLSGSGEALLKLHLEGVEEVYDHEQSVDKKLTGYRIKGLKDERLIEKEIPLPAINLFRENVKVLDYRHLADFHRLKTILGSLEKQPSYGEGETFPEAEVKVERFPTDHSVFKIKGKTIGKVWLEILDHIMKFGVVKKSDYAEDQKEILNLTAVITDEHPRDIQWEEYFQFSREHLQDYLPLMLTDKKVEGVQYTYGGRLRNWRGIDQIDSLIKKLKKSLYSRRAVAVTWDVGKDCEEVDVPCIDLIQCLVQDDLLFMTVFIRSNDMFDGWPENALALRELQFVIAEEIGIKMGSLTTISGSAHIYQRNWNKSLELIEKYSPVVKQLSDARGNFVISLKDGLINVEHQSPQGVVLETIAGQTALEVSLKLARQHKVSEIYHAFYLGRELAKAELALKNGLQYEQEMDLSLGGGKKMETDQRGKFVVVEGLDGAGKAQGFLDIFAEEARKEGRKIFDLNEYWKKFNHHPPFEELKNFDVLLTSEPTYEGLGRYIRDEMIANNDRHYSAEADAEAYALNRRILHEQVIIPALEKGIDIYQSRSVGSFVYQLQSAIDQDKEEEFDVDKILALPGNVFCLENSMDYLIIPTIKDVNEAIRRSQTRDKDDDCKFENLDFQLKIKPHYESDWFREIFEKHGVKVIYMDAGQTLEYSNQQARDFYQKELRRT